MNTDILKMFIIISQKGSISQAAEELGYAQSNISTKVHQLEADLGTKLFYRNNRGITLTDAGKQLYQQAIKIVRLTEETINSLKHPEQINGELKIGTLQTAASTFLPEVLSTYHQQNPQVKLSIQTGTTLKSAQAVLDYELDGAIIGGHVSDPDLVSVHLTNEELCLASSIDGEPDLNTTSLLVFPVGCGYRKTLESWLDSQKIMIHHPIEFNYLNAIIASVSAGLGISILPKKVADPFVKTGALKIQKLPDPYNNLPVSFIHRKDHVVTRSYENFLNTLTDFFRIQNR